MGITDLIKRKIAEKLAPAHFELINESDRHKGHAGHDGSGESHFKLIVVSKSFCGYNSMERHRMVYSALSEAFSQGLHALSIKAFTPDEFAKK
jgi:BolA family transcriptional regulator, general stress-responsive regulator